jgi:hypothetical protein
MYINERLLKSSLKQKTPDSIESGVFMKYTEINTIQSLIRLSSIVRS